MTELKIGLEGIAIAETKISEVRGDKGQLIYHGYWVEDLVKSHTYEDIVYLLWNEKLPTKDESIQFKKILASKRKLPSFLKEVIEKMPKHLSSMEVLRTAISFLAPVGEKWPPSQEDAMDIL